MTFLSLFHLIAGLALCTAQMIMMTELGAYPEYVGSAITGTVRLKFADDHVIMNYRLQGVEAACSSANPDAANSCGIHIHSGTSCVTTTEPGGHYYNADVVGSDPWTTAVYIADDTTATGSVTVGYGYDWDSTEGKVLVIHDRSGARVTCMPIEDSVAEEEKILVHDLGSYPDYAGGLNMGGSLRASFQGTSVNIEYNLHDVEADCTSPDPDAPNSCGIHIHSGTSCETADLPQGHYYNPAMAADPWSTVVYQTTAGKTSASGRVIVEYGYTWQETEGKVLVLHDRSGARVTCVRIVLPDAELARFTATATDENCDDEDVDCTVLNTAVGSSYQYVTLLTDADIKTVCTCSVPVARRLLASAEYTVVVNAKTNNGLATKDTKAGAIFAKVSEELETAAAGILVTGSLELVNSAGEVYTAKTDDDDDDSNWFLRIFLILRWFRTFFQWSY